MTNKRRNKIKSVREKAKRPWRKAIVRQEVATYKLTKGCADCGYNKHSEALQFDHLPGFKKISSVSLMIGQMRFDKVWQEIAKCEVVCANCHAIRTAARRDLTKG